MSPTLLLLISFASDFIITAGGIVSGAMLATKEVTLPNQAVLVLALITGVVVAARRAQALLQPSAIEKPPDVAATVAALVAALTAATPVPVTPKRADEPPPNPVKDSS